ncbi:MAG: membrane-binding protein, partial [Chitinophagaceae bacterium]
DAQTIVIRIGQHPGSTSSSLRNWRPAAAPAASTSAASQTPYYVQEIMNTIGLRPNFTVQAARIDNAAAVTYNGQRYILYNPTFIDNLVQRTGNKWAAVSVLAHEIGHHLDGHTVTSSGSQPQLELEADEFSGYVLRKMGASLADAQAAMKTIATERGSATHPGRSDRLASIAAGWNRANGTTGASVATAQPRSNPDPYYPQRSAPQPIVRRGASPIAERNILGDLSFHSDPNTRYFVTTDYNVVKVQDNRLYVLGKMARSNNRSYPYIIYDNQTKMLVHASGAVVTESGRTVGRLTAHA